MRRLFLRFYFGVVAILVAAWLVQSYVMRSREADNARVAVKALAGGVRLARDTVLAAGPDNEAEGLAKANAAFDYPVYIVPASKRPMYPHDEERLREVGVIFYNDRILCRLPPGDRMLELGPLPQFIGPTQGEYFLGYGAVFALAAAAIAVLLRPVASQLRSLERAATEIASGDMSARIRDRRAVGNLAVAVAFNSMADRVESVLRSQRELLQAVSHELRTPLARIRFATELIASAKTEVERAKRLKSVDDATEQLDNLVGELLGYARVDSEVAANRGQRIDLGELVAEVVELHSPLHPNVRFEIDSRAAGEVTADRPSLARALGNLIGNAGKNASEQVEISAELNGEGVVIRVDDDGPGVPPADRERIFEPFVRLASSRAGGVGLGLALVKRIVESRGGRVECKDSPLGGARFEVSLPNGELP